MNPDISSANFKLSLSILILNSRCVEGARYVHKLTPITSIRTKYFCKIIYLFVNETNDIENQLLRD